MKNDTPAKKRPRPDDWVTALVADRNGEIFELEGYAAVGMAGSDLAPFRRSQTLAMPRGSELMLLPDRRPVVYHIMRRKMEVLSENPFAPGEPIFPVAAFNSPGYVASRVAAYEEAAGADFLPLFSYGAVGWHGGGFRSAVIRVDREPRQDLRHMKWKTLPPGSKRCVNGCPVTGWRAIWKPVP